MYRRSGIVFGITTMIYVFFELLIVNIPNMDELLQIYVKIAQLIAVIVFFIYDYLDYKKHGSRKSGLNKYDWMAFFSILFCFVAINFIDDNAIKTFLLLLSFPIMFFYIFIQGKNPNLL